MFTNSLHKIIPSLILPRFPWIIDYEISALWDAPHELYTITYYVEPDDDGSFTVNDEMGRVEKLTYDLFKMVGGNSLQTLDEVVFNTRK